MTDTTGIHFYEEIPCRALWSADGPLLNPKENEAEEVMKALAWAEAARI